MKILAVEDEATYLYILKEIFQTAGFEVVTAPGGNEALKVLRSEKVDCVVTDHRMRPMSGLQLIARIKEEEELSDIPVIMITGDDSMETIIEAADQNVDGYIMKPFDAHAVIEKVKMVVGSGG